MSDLVEFLLARVAEDEERARAATPGPWDVYGTDGRLWTDGDVLSIEPGGRQSTIVDDFDRGWLSISVGDAQHIARWDPGRVLAECEAKRRIVEEVRDLIGDDETWALQYGNAAQQVAVTTLRLLALPYADHPDFDGAWRP